MYDLIRVNKRNSWLLIFLCALVLLGLAASIGLAASEGDPEAGVAFAILAIPVFFVLFMVSWFGGRRMVLTMSGARRIEHSDHPQLFNVVEEMAIAAGLPMPDVFIIEDSAPNAFATGRDPAHSAVAVTTGLLEKLNRDELQGVIAHEMSHIRNYDIRFALLMAVMVGTIALISDAFLRGVFRGSGRRSSRKEGGGGHIILLLIAILFALLAPLIGKLIQLAVSRQREFLADSSAAELTRYPEGLASALLKISRDDEVLEVANRATQHMYIVNPIKPFEDRAKALFSTHPPIEERVARLRSIAQQGEIRNPTQE